jgi:hypothetical protein
MIDQLLASEYLFWLVAILFFVLGNIKLVPPGKLLLAETIGGNFKPQFVFNSFEIKGAQVQLLNLLLPYAGFIQLDINPKKNVSQGYDETTKELKNLSEGVFFLKFVSVSSFFCLISGPFLTHYFGISAALIFLAPIHLANLLLKKNKMQLTNGEVAAIFFDCLVVPSYLPNIVNKIYSKKVFYCDGFYYALQVKNDAEKENLNYLIHRKFELMENVMQDHDIENYQIYYESLGLKNDLT